MRMLVNFKSIFDSLCPSEALKNTIPPFQTDFFENSMINLLFPKKAINLLNEVSINVAQ